LMQEIKHHFQENDLLKMGTTAHKLKGSALNVGAALFAEVCKKLEIKGREGDATDVQSLIDEMFKLYNQTADALKRVV
jgi:HPt (histidine-containing phosphotransfer) domain-containing protein